MRIAAALVASFFLSACSSAPPAKPAIQPEPSAEKASELAPQLRAWVVTASTNKMDHSPEVSLIKTAEDVNGALIVRCSRGKTDVYVATDQIVDNGSVRVKFDSEPPRRQDWVEGSGHDALFSRDAINLARKLATTETLLVEYHPFQKVPATLEFRLSGLTEHLASVSDACNWKKFDQAKASAIAASARDRLRDVKIREALARYVEPCHEEWLRDKGRWCWYDASDSFFKDGGSPKETKQSALDDAVVLAKTGRVFVRQLAEIDRELKP